MKFMGSKASVSKYLLPIITNNLKPDQYYIEPFVGGCNMMDKVSHHKKIGLDLNGYLISMWKGIQNKEELLHEIPKTTYSLYRDKYNKCKVPTEYSYDNFMIGWVGFMASFNGRFYDGGYSGHSAGKMNRNYIREQITNTLKSSELLGDVEFYHTSYSDFNYPKNSVIYCDKPYNNTKQYSVSKDFDEDKFWEWARTMTRDGHQVFVSEYNAPSDFKCIWEKKVTVSLNTKKSKRATEKLFIYVPK